MGCCLSSAKPTPTPPPPKIPTSAAENRAPPPSYEEETVKEVLSSETPNPKPPRQPHFAPQLPPRSPPPDLIVPEKKEIPEVDLPPPPPAAAAEVEKVGRNGLVEEKVEVSEQDPSEVCSVSVSVSESVMSTMTNDEEVKQPVNRRSPASKTAAARNNRMGSTADSGPRKERVVGRSPTRRSDRSPAKRNYAGGGGQMRPGQNRDPGRNNPTVRRPLRPDLGRRDPGDSSGRRSRSPATHRSTPTGNRNGPTKRTMNQSPGRVRKEPSEISGGGDSRQGKETEEDVTSTANESLENPLVSLECFIFL